MLLLQVHCCCCWYNAAAAGTMLLLLLLLMLFATANNTAATACPSWNIQQLTQQRHKPLTWIAKANVQRAQLRIHPAAQTTTAKQTVGQSPKQSLNPQVRHTVPRWYVGKLYICGRRPAAQARTAHVIALMLLVAATICSADHQMLRKPSFPILALSGRTSLPTAPHLS